MKRMFKFILIGISNIRAAAPSPPFISIEPLSTKESRHTAKGINKVVPSDEDSCYINFKLKRSRSTFASKVVSYSQRRACCVGSNMKRHPDRLFIECWQSFEILRDAKFLSALSLATRTRIPSQAREITRKYFPENGAPRILFSRHFSLSFGVV